MVSTAKKDRKLHFCVDYRTLNELTLRDTNPFPRIDECNNSLVDAAMFSTDDCNSELEARSECGETNAMAPEDGGK